MHTFCSWTWSGCDENRHQFSKSSAMVLSQKTQVCFLQVRGETLPKGEGFKYLKIFEHWLWQRAVVAQSLRHRTTEVHEFKSQHCQPATAWSLSNAPKLLSCINASRSGEGLVSYGTNVMIHQNWLIMYRDITEIMIILWLITIKVKNSCSLS